MSLYVSTISPTKGRIITDGAVMRDGRMNRTDQPKARKLPGGCMLVCVGSWACNEYADFLASLKMDTVTFTPTGQATIPSKFPSPFQFYMTMLHCFGLAHPKPEEDRTCGEFYLIGAVNGQLHEFCIGFATDVPEAGWVTRHGVITSGLSLTANGWYQNREEVLDRFRAINKLPYDAALPEMAKVFYDIRRENSRCIGGTTFVFDLSLVDGQLQIEQRDIPEASCEPQVVGVGDEGLTYGKTLQTALTSGAVDMSKYGGTGIVGKLPNSTILNDQSSITGNPNAAPSYTSTTTSITWSWGAFDLYFPDGTTISVSSGSHSFTGLTASTTYFFEMYVVKATGVMTVVLSDQSSGTAASSLQFQVQTVAADGHAVQFIDITASTPSSGSGGGSGTGGTCFSGDTKIKTDSGFVRMDELPSEFTVVNQTGNHRAQLIVHENSAEPMRVMPDGCLVTDEHLFQREDGTWTPARELFDTIAPQTSRTVYNVHVVTETPDDMHYILENGFIAHNKKRVCFSGGTPIRTTHGFIRMNALPEQFEIVNRDGTFPARLIRHEDCKDSMCALPNVGLVSGVHLLRRSGEIAWTEATKMFPASADSPAVLFNIHVDGSDFFELLGSIEANHMRGA